MDALVKRQKYEIKILENMVAMYVKGHPMSIPDSNSTTTSTSGSALGSALGSTPGCTPGSTLGSTLDSTLGSKLSSGSASVSCPTDTATLSKQECDEFLKYAVKRVHLCPKGIQKTSCRRCEIHCYTSEQRRRAKLIMSYSGPRFIFHHPVMAVWHLFHEILMR